MPDVPESVVMAVQKNNETVKKQRAPFLPEILVKLDAADVKKRVDEEKIRATMLRTTRAKECPSKDLLNHVEATIAKMVSLRASQGRQSYIIRYIISKRGGNVRENKHLTAVSKLAFKKCVAEVD